MVDWINTQLHVVSCLAPFGTLISLWAFFVVVVFMHFWTVRDSFELVPSSMTLAEGGPPPAPRLPFPPPPQCSVYVFPDLGGSLAA